MADASREQADGEIRPALLGMTVTRHCAKTQSWATSSNDRKLLAVAVAFFVFFAGAAGAGVVAADFCASADRFWRLRLARGRFDIAGLFAGAPVCAPVGARSRVDAAARKTAVRRRALRRWPWQQRLRRRGAAGGLFGRGATGPPMPGRPCDSGDVCISSGGCSFC